MSTLSPVEVLIAHLCIFQPYQSSVSSKTSILSRGTRRLKRHAAAMPVQPPGVRFRTSSAHPTHGNSYIKAFPSKYTLPNHWTIWVRGESLVGNCHGHNGFFRRLQIEGHWHAASPCMLVERRQSLEKSSARGLKIVS